MIVRNIVVPWQWGSQRIKYRYNAKAAVWAERTFSNSLPRNQRYPDPSLVDARSAPVGFDPSFAVVYRDFLTPQEAETLAQDVLGRMKRYVPRQASTNELNEETVMMCDIQSSQQEISSKYAHSRRYEKGHWDAVITGYKEVEMHDESFPDVSTIPDIFDRVRQHLGEHHLSNSKDIQWLPCHAIDLKKDGELKAHVDSVRFSGGLVAGISLLSPSIMRLVPDDNGDHDATPPMTPTSSLERGHVDLFLPPNSLYALTGDGRYKYSHQLLPDSSVFTSPTDGTETLVRRGHRLSIIFRDAKSDPY
jgi:alkylated DNA repair protein alkB homolog 7